MDHPYYTYTVTSLTRGWTYTTTEGDEWDPADDVVLTSPFTYAWSFKDGLVPAQLDTFAADVNLTGRTAADLPTVDVGDLITIDVRVGTTGQRIIAPPPMRVAAAVVSLGTGAYKASLGLALSDLSVDWRARKLTLPGWGWPVAPPSDSHIHSRVAWLDRMAEYSWLLGISIGRQSSWSGTEGPPVPGGPIGSVFLLDTVAFPGTAEEELEALINSHVPEGITYSWATVYNASYPTGYQWSAPSTWAYSAAPYNDYPVSDPGSTVKILPVPASRLADTEQGLPVEFVVVGGMLKLRPSVTGATGIGHTAIGLDADWCVLPTQARRARDGAINVVKVTGPWHPAELSRTESGFALYPYGAVDVVDAADVAARGPSVREVPTKLRIHWAVTTLPGPYTSDAVAPVANAFLSDPSVDDTVWSYDGFELRSSLIPQATAAWLLSLVAPRLPGETNGDDRVLKHVTIYSIDPDLRFDGQPVTGFVTGGTMTIAGGDIVWNLDTTPGWPVWDDPLTLGGPRPASITVGEFADFVDGLGLTFEDVDPSISFADLAYVGAP